MLFKEKLRAELARKDEDFRRHASDMQAELRKHLDALSALERLSPLELSEILRDKKAAEAYFPELESKDSFRCSFDHRWDNHEQARRWALDVLDDRTTFAADGSQLYAEKETSLPIGAVQVGWFENPHNALKPYEKNADFRILSPKDLIEGQDDPVNPETRVGEERFYAEAAAVSDFLTRKSGWRERGEPMPVAFFDGTLLISFSLPQTRLQTSFIDTMVRLVRHSRETGVPLVGYVDRSFARDLLSVLVHLTDGEPSKILYDTALLCGEVSGRERVLRSWGDRTTFCLSKRPGMESFVGSDGRPIVGFAYLQTTAGSAPARLDLPAWIYDAGLLNEVIDVVRAECVIGLGYPYALETADATAVISVGDREIFFRALQEFATREKLDFSVTRKQTSKGRRR